VKEKFTENLDEGSDLSGERAFESHGAPQQGAKNRIRQPFKAHPDSIFLHSTYPGIGTSDSFVAACRGLPPDDANKTSPATPCVHLQTGQNRGSCLNVIRDLILPRRCEQSDARRPGSRVRPPGRRKRDQ
jgi:hypothetical protein